MRTRIFRTRLGKGILYFRNCNHLVPCTEYKITIMKKKTLLGFALVSMTLLYGCADIITEPMHSPLYPDGDEDVEITVEAQSDDGIKTVKLYETVSDVNAAGVVTAGTENLIQTWNVVGAPAVNTQSYTKVGGYGDDKIVTYRFHVTNDDNKTRSHEVSFATRPYPVPNQPVPVYAQGDPDDVMDLVFIPDEEINDMDEFRDRCQALISGTMHTEPTLNLMNRQFNYYINPVAGDAVPFGTGAHTPPPNNANLAFAEAKALLHSTVFRDFASGNMFSMEWDRPQTLLHENGHAMFDLADEYGNGVHWEEATLPNNWDDLADAQADAASRGKDPADAVEMGTSGWYKLCDGTCPMASGSALLFDFQSPCSGRIMHVIIDNLIH